MFRKGPARLAGRTWRWRSLYFAFSALAACALVGGVTYATLTDPLTASIPISPGTVALSVHAVSKTCPYAMLTPGDLTGTPSEQCVLAVDYTGTVPAFVSLTVEIESTSGLGGSPLYDGTNSAGLTFSISDGHTTFTVPALPTVTGTTGAPCPPNDTCWTSPYDLAAWYDNSGNPFLSFTNGTSVTWTVTPLFPTTVGNDYQGGTANLILTAQAVNGAPLPLACTTSTIGQSCPASGNFAWN